MVVRLYHFSEDPSIELFEPHVPPSNPTQPASVWTIDAVHAPLYWFPRDCPRVTAWCRDEDDPDVFANTFGTDARRIHAVELEWLTRIRKAELYCYEFDGSAFEPWSEAAGQWVSSTSVTPMSVTRVGDLLQRHADAGVELRLVENLWHLADVSVDNRWGFSLVRMRNAQPQPSQE